MKNWPLSIMEITVISAQGLKNTALFSHRRIRPFITLTTTTNGDNHRHLYKTRVDDKGGVDPTWGDKFHIPIDPTTLFSQRNSPCIYLKLYTKRLMAGWVSLGWCPIMAADIIDGLLPEGGIRRLSYRIRARDGSRGHGVVNIAVKLQGLAPVELGRVQRPAVSDKVEMPEMGVSQTVMGFPVGIPPAYWERSSMSNGHELGLCKLQTQVAWAVI